MPAFCFYCGADGGVFNCQSDTEILDCKWYKKTLEPLDSFMETQKSIGDWQSKTFPNVSLYSSVVRMLQEAHELVGLFWIDRDHALQHPQMPPTAKIANEIADVYITLVGVAEKAGINIEQAVNDKMKVNRQRKWKIGKDGCGQHEA